LEGKRDQALPAPVVTDLVNQFQSSNPKNLVPPSPPLKRDPKRQKPGMMGTEEEKEKKNGNSLNLAGSQVERRLDK
jgi:hypothetical protein